MNILFLEDQGVVVGFLVADLEDKGHTVFIAPNIPRANFYWSSENIDCVIADSNMPPDGLTDEQRDETHGGLLSGWVWLKYYVFKDKPVMRKRTIICTGYLAELEEMVAAKERAGIRVVAKRRLVNLLTKTVLEYVEEIEQELASGGGKDKED